MTSAATPSGAKPMEPPDFDRLEDVLDDMRTRHEETPQWEFCEGFLAALICCRRLIMPSEYLPVLLDFGDSQSAGAFRDQAQAAEFMSLWMRRWNEVAAALNNDAVESLDDPACYHPEVMDVRAMVAALPPNERSKFDDQELPSFAQVWALGFMAAVEHWTEDWAPPRNQEEAQWLQEALQSVAALLEDDRDAPTISPFDEQDPPSLSAARLEDFGAAIWAVYELRELWRSLGPRVQTVRKEAAPGRNELCWCGSGKKYKKCHGAN